MRSLKEIKALPFEELTDDELMLLNDEIFSKWISLSALPDDVIGRINSIRSKRCTGLFEGTDEIPQTIRDQSYAD